MTKPHRKIFQINKPIRNLCANALLVFALVFLLVSICLLPEYAYAAQAVDAFEEVHKKLNGWVSGSFGKLITFISLVLSGVLGAMGFPARHVLGAIGVGLILASANSLVGFLFA